MSAEEMFRRQTMTLERLESSRDAGGGVRHTWTQVGGEFRGQVEDPSSEDVEKFAQQNMVVTHQIFVLETDINEATTGNRIRHDGRFFLIHGKRLRRGKGTIPGFWNLLAEEQDG